MTKKVFKISGMHCTSCAMNIDGELEDTDGVKQANTNYARSVTEVEFDESKLNDKKIINIIEKTGYKADNV
nr:heavy-metal-associated domain-containing protein [Candidatus Levybacteria bacterium]